MPAEPLPPRQAGYLTQGSESRSLDFKQSRHWSSDKEFRLKIIRTILAMSNLQDGGAIVIGVSESPDGYPTVTGMSQEDFDSYNTDDVAAQVAKYADPPVGCQVIKGTSSGEHLIVVIEVPGLTRIPTVCKASDGGTNVLRAGALYIRPLGKPESREVMTAFETSELLDAAIRARIQELRQLGLLTDSQSGHTVQAANRAAFDAELEDLT